MREHYNLKKVSLIVLLIAIILAVIFEMCLNEDESLKMEDFSFNLPEGYSVVNIPNDKNLDVWVQVWLRDIDETPTWTDPWFPPKDETKTISISLYKVGEVGEAATLVGSFSACANDKKTTHTFSNLDTTSEYFLEFEKETSLGARMRYDGKGNVSDVTVTVN